MVSSPVIVGVLNPAGRPVADEVERASLERLRALGWIGGQNLVVEIRRAEGNAAVLQTLASELVQRVRVIVASGTTAIQAARLATDSVPIVMAGGGDPVASCLVSLAQAGWQHYWRVFGGSGAGRESSMTLAPPCCRLCRPHPERSQPG